MNSVTTTSIQALSQAPIEALRVEKPPVAIVAKAWQTASNRFMPHSMSSTTCAKVSRAYTPQRMAAVSRSLGRRRSALGPGTSPRNIW